jgi:hypothetical protein
VLRGPLAEADLFYESPCKYEGERATCFVVASVFLEMQPLGGCEFDGCDAGWYQDFDRPERGEKYWSLFIPITHLSFVLDRDLSAQIGEGEV